MSFVLFHFQEKMHRLGRKFTDFHSQTVTTVPKSIAVDGLRQCWALCCPISGNSGMKGAIFVWTAPPPPSHCTTPCTTPELFLLSWQWINPQVSVTGKVLHKDCMSVSIPNVCRSHNRDKNRKERKIGIRIKKKAQRMAQGVTGVCQHSRPSPSTAESWLVPPGSAWWPYSHQSRRNFKFKSSTALRSDLGQLPEPQLCQKLPSLIT